MDSNASRGSGDASGFADAPETRLVDALRAGESAAAEFLVRTHGGWMLAVAGRILHDHSAAEDCVQEAFLKALDKISDFEQRSSLKSWLHRIVVNQALMKLRWRKGRNEAPIEGHLPEFDENACRIEAPWQKLETPEDILDRSDRRAMVQAKIRDLPESYRLVLQLRDIEELSTREVAEVLDMSEANVKVRLHRARSALKKLLEPLLRGEA